MFLGLYCKRGTRTLGYHRCPAIAPSGPGRETSGSNYLRLSRLRAVKPYVMGDRNFIPISTALLYILKHSTIIRYIIYLTQMFYSRTMLYASTP